jgi:hypothetical protein
MNTNELVVWKNNAPIIDLPATSPQEFDVWKNNVPVIPLDESKAVAVASIRRRVFEF